MRGTQNCKKRLIQEMKKRVDEFHEKGDEIWVGVDGSFVNQKEHQEWMNMAREIFKGEDINYDPLTFSIGCHVGPGPLGWELVKNY